MRAEHDPGRFTFVCKNALPNSSGIWGSSVVDVGREHSVLLNHVATPSSWRLAIYVITTYWKEREFANESFYALVSLFSGSARWLC